MIGYLIIMERERTIHTASAEAREGRREHFDVTFNRFLLGQTERPNADGTMTEVRAYEFVLDPHDQTERRGTIATFALQALAAGYCQALAPIVMPDVGFRAADQPLVAVYWFLEVPPETTPSVVNQ